MLSRQVEATFTPALRQFLADKGFDAAMGARPMHRLIQDRIRKALADELLFGRLAEGGEVLIDYNGKKDEVVLRFGQTRPASKKLAQADV